MLLTLLCNQFNHVFAILISLLLFKSNNLYQTRPENKSLLHKIAKKFERWGLCPQTPNGFRRLDSASIRESTALPPDSQWLPAAGLCPHTRKHIPPIANFWLCSWLVVSIGIANALHQNFGSMTSTKK